MHSISILLEKIVRYVLLIVAMGTRVVDGVGAEAAWEWGES